MCKPSRVKVKEDRPTTNAAQLTAHVPHFSPNMTEEEAAVDVAAEAAVAEESETTRIVRDNHHLGLV